MVSGVFDEDDDDEEEEEEGDLEMGSFGEGKVKHRLDFSGEDDGA